MASTLGASASRLITLGYQNDESSEATEEALKLAQIQLKVRVTRIIRRCVNWKKGMVFDAWSCNVRERIRLRRTIKSVIVRWNNKLLVGSFQGWKAGALIGRGIPHFTYVPRKSRVMSIVEAENLQMKMGNKPRPHTYTGSLPVLWPNQNMAFQDLRTKIVSPGSNRSFLANVASHPQAAYKFSFASYVAADTQKDLRQVKEETSAEMLEKFRRLWNDTKIFSEFCDASLPEDGKGHYCLRSLGQRSNTMDFKELLCLLSSESLLAERGSIYDPSKLTVSTVHSVFRVVNLKCYTAWWSTRKAKKEIDASEGAADKFELGFKEYQMVMLTLGCELGVSVSDITRGSSRFYDPQQIARILALAKYDSNRLAHTSGAPLHVARSRFREPDESGVDLLTSALAAAQRGEYERAHMMAKRATQIFLLSRRPDLLCEVHIVENRINAMEHLSAVREKRMQNAVCHLLLKAESHARALDIDGSRHLLKDAGDLAEKGNFPKRGSLQEKFDNAVKSLDEAELVIKGDEKLNQAWECVQRDELNDAERFLFEAQDAYASTDLRGTELKNCRDALERKRHDEQRIRTLGRSFMTQAREAVKEEHFSEAARLMDEAHDAFVMWTSPAGQNAVIVTKLTEMISKTWSNRFLFEAFCAFDDKNLSGQGSRALMMDFNEFLHLLQDLGVLEVKHKKQVDLFIQKGPLKPKRASIDPNKVDDSKFKGRDFQIELCRQCSFPEIHDSPSCKLAKADVYEIFRAVNLRSVAQLHRGNTEADSDMSSLDFSEYELCMLRIGKLLGLPLTDSGGSPLFVKDLRDLEDLRTHFIDVKREVRERLLVTGEKSLSLAKKAMQECNFLSAREHLESSVSQYQRIDDEKIQRHYVSNCRRIAEMIDREEKREVIRKAEYVTLADAALAKIKGLLDEYDELGCSFDEQKFKICETEAENAWRYYKNAQSYGTQQKDIIQELKSRIQSSEQRIAQQRQALWQGKEELHCALEIMESCPSFMQPNDVMHCSHNTERFIIKVQNGETALHQFNGNPHESRLLDHSGVLNAAKFEEIMSRLEKSKSFFVLAKDHTAQRSYESMLRQFVSFAKNWTTLYSLLGYSHLHDAKYKSKCALSAATSDERAIMGFFNEAEKSLRVAESFMKKALEPQCAKRYVEEGSELFSMSMIESFAEELKMQKQKWKDHRRAEQAEMSECAAACHNHIQSNELSAAIDVLHRAKELGRGGNHEILTKLEGQIQIKMIEEEAKTEGILVEVRTTLTRSNDALNDSMINSGLQIVDECLRVVNQVRSLSLNPNAIKLRDEILGTRKKFWATAHEIFDSCSTKILLLLSEVMNFLYSARFEEAGTKISHVKNHISTMETQGVLEIVRTDETKENTIQHIMISIETALTILAREGDIIDSIHAERQLNASTILQGIDSCLSEYSTAGVSLQGKELQYVQHRFATAQMLSSQLKSFHHIGEILQSHQESQDSSYNEWMQKALASLDEASKSFAAGENIQALHRIEIAEILNGENPNQNIPDACKRLRNEIFSSSSTYLEEQYIDACEKLAEVRNAMACKQYDAALLTLKGLRFTLEEDDIMQESIFIVSHSTDHEHQSMVGLFPSALSDVVRCASEAEEGLSTWTKKMRSAQKDMAEQITVARRALRSYDLSGARRLLDSIESTLSSDSMYQMEKEIRSVRALSELLSTAEKTWLEEEQQLNKQDEVTGLSPLFSICKKGDLEILLKYLRHKPDLKLVDSNHWSFLHHAAANGHVKCLTILLQHNCDVNAQTKEGLTALMLAVKEGHVDAVKELLQSGASTTIRDSDQRIALHHCALHNRCDFIESILWPLDSSFVDQESDLSRLDFQLDCRDATGFTSLMLAISCGNVKTAKALLSSGANPRLTDGQGLNALHLAAKYGIIEIISCLSELVRDVDCPSNSSGASPLMIGSEYGRVAAVKTLLDCHADPNFQDKTFRTALHVTCASGEKEEQVAISKLLLEAGSDLTIQDSSGLTPIHITCIYDCPTLLQLLTSSIYFPVTGQAAKSVFLCVLNARYDCLNKLQSHFKGNFEMYTVDGWNALHLAILMGDERSVALISQSADTELLTTCLGDIQNPTLQRFFFKGDSPTNIAQKCVHLSELLDTPNEFYGVIHSILISSLKRLGVDEEIFGSENRKIKADEIRALCTEFSNPCKLNCRKVFDAINVAKHDQLDKDVDGHKDQLIFDKNVFLARIQEAERVDLRQIRCRVCDLRKKRMEAIEFSRTGNRTKALEVLNDLTMVLSSYQDGMDSYESTLHQATKESVNHWLADFDLRALEGKIKDLVTHDDAERGVLNLISKDGSVQSQILGEERKWNQDETDRMITAVIELCLESLLSSTQSEHEKHLLDEKITSCEAQFASIKAILRAAYQDISMTNFQDMQVYLKNLKYTLHEFEGSIRDYEGLVENPLDERYLRYISASTHISQDISEVEAVNWLERNLPKVKNLMANHPVPISVAYTRLMLKKAKKKATLLNGSELISSEKYEKDINFAEALAGKSTEHLELAEVQATLNVLTQGLGRTMLHDQVGEAEEQVQDIIRSCKESFNSSHYAACLSRLQNLAIPLTLCDHAVQSRNIAWMVVFKLHISLLHSIQEEAEAQLIEAEQIQEEIFNRLACIDGAADEGPILVSKTESEDKYDKAKSLFLRAFDNRADLEKRMQNFHVGKETIEAKLRDHELRKVVRFMVDAVEQEHLSRAGKQALQELMNSAVSLFKKAQYEQCISTLDAIAENPFRTLLGPEFDEGIADLMAKSKFGVKCFAASEDAKDLMESAWRLIQDGAQQHAADMTILHFRRLRKHLRDPSVTSSLLDLAEDITRSQYCQWINDLCAVAEQELELEVARMEDTVQKSCSRELVRQLVQIIDEKSSAARSRMCAVISPKIESALGHADHFLHEDLRNAALAVDLINHFSQAMDAVSLAKTAVESCNSKPKVGAAVLVVESAIEKVKMFRQQCILGKGPIVTTCMKRMHFDDLESSLEKCDKSLKERASELSAKEESLHSCWQAAELAMANCELEQCVRQLDACEILAEVLGPVKQDILESRIAEMRQHAKTKLSAVAEERRKLAAMAQLDELIAHGQYERARVLLERIQAPDSLPDSAVVAAAEDRDKKINQ